IVPREPWKNYLNSFKYAGIGFTFLSFTSMYVSISRNFINITKCGVNKGIDFNGDALDTFGLCLDTSGLPSDSYNYFPTRQQKARMEIANNTIILSGKTNFTSLVTQPDGYLSQHSMAISFSASITSCDSILIFGNLATLQLERPMRMESQEVMDAEKEIAMLC